MKGALEIATQPRDRHSSGPFDEVTRAEVVTLVANPGDLQPRVMLAERLRSSQYHRDDKASTDSGYNDGYCWDDA